MVILKNGCYSFLTIHCKEAKMKRITIRSPKLKMQYYVEGTPDLTLIPDEILKSLAYSLVPKVEKHFEDVTKQGQSKKDSKKLVDSS